MASEELEVSVAKLQSRLNPEFLEFETTADVPSIAGILGQERALRALEFGLRATNSGTHVYAAGPVGTGKMTAIQTVLARLKGRRPTPPDWCYVHDFDDSDRPRALSLPAGRGQQLVQDMEHLIEGAQGAIPRAFESEDYAQRKAAVLRKFEEEGERLHKEVAEDARQQGFSIEATPVGLVTVPLIGGRPATKEEYEALPEEERRALQERGEKIKQEVEQALRRTHGLEQEAKAQVEQLDHYIAGVAVGPLLDAMRQKYADLPPVADFLDRVRADIPEHLGDFRRRETEAGEAMLAALLREDHLVRYRVNLLVDNSRTEGAPVVVELEPTYYNLFGRIDYRARLGSMVTDFTMVRAGSIHRANGGYLVIQARDALTGLFVWETLKRTLRCGQARIQNLGEQYSPIPSATIRPQPIPVTVKVVLVGPALLHYLLDSFDEDFQRLFGIRADFGVDIERSEERVAQYASFVSSLAHHENLKPFHRSAVARIIDFASRVAEHQRRLSTRFLEVGRMAREASTWAECNEHSVVLAEDVDHAIAEHDYRASLFEDILRREVVEHTVHIDTGGATIGQVNGLSVVDLGDHSFGRPVRITARTSLGTRGVVNIEREIELSGRIHSKGVLILASYLAGKYAQDKPLALSASLTFEQTYDEVDGDSASGAELYALLSSLSGLPVKQGIAVTGSVNQLGEIQAIGGANAKIEGFFRLCKERGLTGEQGVVIPGDNVKHLMLKDEVVGAIGDGKFHVWAIDSVDQGIEILTGVPAGDKLADGMYADGTVNCLVDRQLTVFAERLKEFRPSLATGEAVPFRPLPARRAAKQARGHGRGRPLRHWEALGKNRS